MSDKIHIHAPEPIKIIDLNSESGTPDRFGRRLILTDCCKKKRIIQNCEMQIFEWYDPWIFCKKGKGCKK